MAGPNAQKKFESTPTLHRYGLRVGLAGATLYNLEITLSLQQMQPRKDRGDNSNKFLIFSIVFFQVTCDVRIRDQAYGKKHHKVRKSNDTIPKLYCGGWCVVLHHTSIQCVSEFFYSHIPHSNSAWFRF